LLRFVHRGRGQDLQTLVFWAFFRTIFDWLSISSTFRLSSILGIFYGFIWGDRIKARRTDCKTIEKNLKKLEKS
jgi:hypothetical protein